MNNFIFWKNIPSNTLAIDSIKQRIAGNSAMSPVDLKVFSNECGIIFSNNKDKPSILYEDQNIVVYSPTLSLQYKNLKGKEACSKIVDDFLNKSQIYPGNFNHTFSILIVNKTTNEVQAAIDKFGIEKLYYSYNDNGLIISNKLSAIESLYPAALTISDQAVFNYVDAHIIPSPLTIYKEVRKFEPSESIRFSKRAGEVEKNIYWLPTYNENLSLDVSLLAEQTRNALEQSIRNCELTTSTGAFLSGGLDSSTVAGYMAKLSTTPVTAYTMGFEEAGYDETEYARLAAKHFNINLKSYYVTPNDVAMAFSDVIRFFDEPFGNSSAIPAYLCARFASDNGITTMLAGDGGDEIFAGNERYAKQHIFEFYKRIPASIRKILLEPLFSNSLPYTRMQPFLKVKNYIEQASTPMPDRMERYNFINHFSASNIFTEDFLGSVDQTLPILQKRQVYNRPENASMLNRMLYMDWKFTLADNDLVKVGTACNLANINVKYPMLDDILLKQSVQIPTALKMKKGRELRSFYKETMKDFLPNEIINKKKHGFGLPFGEWLKKSPHLQEKMYDNLSSLKARHYFRPDFIDDIIHSHRTMSAASYYGSMVWILAVFQEWMESKGR